MRIRITIEYDPDCETGTTPEDKLEEETQDWMHGGAVQDVLEAMAPSGDGTVKFEYTVDGSTWSEAKAAPWSQADID